MMTRWGFFNTHGLCQDVADDLAEMVEKIMELSDAVKEEKTMLMSPLV